MEKEILSNPNNMIAIIVKLNDNENNTYNIICDQISLGKIDEDNRFITENKEYILDPLPTRKEDIEPNKLYYYFEVNVLDLMEEYQEERVIPILVDYFISTKKDIQLLVIDEYGSKVYTQGYGAISNEIQGGINKRINHEVKVETQERKSPDIYIPSGEVITGDRINVLMLEKYLKERILENDQIIEDMVITIAKNYRAKTKKRVKPMLSIGTTGTGKTATYEAIAEYIGIPCTIYDCNQLTCEGYVGDSLTDVMRKVFITAEQNKKKAERSILVLDEFDKLRAHGSGVKDIDVQNEMLKLFDGYTYSFEVQKNKGLMSLDSSFMTIGACGAFPELFEEKKEVKHLGFCTVEQKQEQEAAKTKITNQDLIEYGMLDQLVGRFRNKFIYKQLDAESFRRILTQSANSPLLDQVDAYLEDYNVILEYTQEFIDAVAEEAYKRGLGARSLGEVISEIFLVIDRDLEIDYLEHTVHPQRKLILTEETVNDNHNYKF